MGKKPFYLVANRYEKLCYTKTNKIFVIKQIFQRENLNSGEIVLVKETQAQIAELEWLQNQKCDAGRRTNF